MQVLAYRRRDQTWERLARFFGTLFLINFAMGVVTGIVQEFGWLFTEMGRQPWIVYGLMKAGAGISPSVSTADVAITLGGFVLLSTVLGIIDVVLMVRAARHGLGPDEEPTAPGQQPAELIY
jgi:cytochrome bd-type quinol oxidase subunit 1